MDKHLLMDKSTISTGPFSVAMLLYQRVSLNPKPSPTLRFMTVGISLAMGCKIDTQLVYAQSTAIFIQIEMFQNHGNLAFFPLTWNRINVESGDLDSKHHGTLLFTLKWLRFTGCHTPKDVFVPTENATHQWNPHFSDLPKIGSIDGWNHYISQLSS